MTIYIKDGKKKKKLTEDHTIYIKMEDGSKIKISEEGKDALSVFSIDEKKVLGITPTGPRRFCLRTFKDWFY